MSDDRQTTNLHGTSSVQDRIGNGDATTGLTHNASIEGHQPATRPCQEPSLDLSSMIHMQDPRSIYHESLELSEDYFQPSTDATVNEEGLMYQPSIPTMYSPGGSIIEYQSPGENSPKSLWPSEMCAIQSRRGCNQSVLS